MVMMWCTDSPGDLEMLGTEVKVPAHIVRVVRWELADSHQCGDRGDESQQKEDIR